MSAPTYTAWAEHHDGNLDTYEGLRRTQAVWRDAWHTRMSGRLRLKRWGYRRDD